MPDFPYRKLVLGFGIGALAGWVGGLLRVPASAHSTSSADAARRLPQEDFGDAPVEQG